MKPLHVSWRSLRLVAAVPLLLCVAAEPVSAADGPQISMPTHPALSATQRRAQGMYSPRIRTTLVGSRVGTLGQPGYAYYLSAVPGGQNIQLAAVRKRGTGYEIVSTSGSFLGTHLAIPGIPARTRLPQLGWAPK